MAIQFHCCLILLNYVLLAYVSFFFWAVVLSRPHSDMAGNQNSPGQASSDGHCPNFISRLL